MRGAAAGVVAAAAWAAAEPTLGRAFGTPFSDAAEAENLVLWPTLLVVDRIHPDRRDGTWPRLATSRRVAAHELATHGLFGLVLGALTRSG